MNADFLNITLLVFSKKDNADDFPLTEELHDIIASEYSARRFIFLVPLV
jgi:hypothetical protein